MNKPIQCMRDVLELQQSICETQRAICLKTGHETMATYYKCRIAEINATIKQIEGNENAVIDARI